MGRCIQEHHTALGMRLDAYAPRICRTFSGRASADLLRMKGRCVRLEDLRRLPQQVLSRWRWKTGRLPHVRRRAEGNKKKYVAAGGGTGSGRLGVTTLRKDGGSICPVGSSTDPSMYYDAFGGGIKLARRSCLLGSRCCNAARPLPAPRHRHPDERPQLPPQGCRLGPGTGRKGQSPARWPKSRSPRIHSSGLACLADPGPPSLMMLLLCWLCGPDSTKGTGGHYAQRNRRTS